AVIWDMDGVIVDSGPYHFRSWRSVFSQRGVDFTESDFRGHFGQRNDTIIRSALGNVSQAEVDAIVAEKESRFRQFVAGHIRAFPGALELIASLHRRRIKMAIASSAPPENIDLITQSLKIRGCFQAIVYGHEVKEGKPSPQGFRLAAEKLGVAPPNCVVFEDAVAGVEAAKRAGMQCVAVTNTHPAASLAQADLVTDSLENVDIEVLEGLFKKEIEQEK
ncbi:MAG: HAD family phosphatase, partial [Kiritimatiellota bacterium]|nr:HAD family phosphatase [Kiritimatiellota bacterium]